MQLHALKQHFSGKLRLTDIKEMFVAIRRWCIQLRSRRTLPRLARETAWAPNGVSHASIEYAEAAFGRSLCLRPRKEKSVTNSRPLQQNRSKADLVHSRDQVCFGANNGLTHRQNGHHGGVAEDRIFVVFSRCHVFGNVILT